MRSEKNAVRGVLSLLTPILSLLIGAALLPLANVYAGVLGERPHQTVPQPTPTVEVGPLPTVTPISTLTPLSSFALTFQMSFAPQFPVAGNELRIEYRISNPAAENAVNVTLRNLLPAALSFIEGESENGELAQETDSDGLALLFHWDEIGPDEVAHATVVVQLADDIPAGAVIDNLAVVFADNANPTSSGISIGLPPARLPTFR